ncbi:MAG: diaminopimelate decarboxylase [Clostridiales bacterium]|nr:diaminopimelate decarboxylase [Clostridiales bacterium]
MKFHGTMTINQHDHLSIGGCDAVELIREFGSPLYVMDEELIRLNCRAFHKAFIEGFPGGEVAYACKAFSCLAMMRIACQEDLGVDVVSAGELYTALAAGVDPARIDFNGNNKTPEELRYALQSGIGRIIVDNFTEIARLDAMAGEMKLKPKALLRIQPGIDAHTHKHIQTGKVDSKFGLAIGTGQALEAVKMMGEAANIELRGIHCHIGSQILGIDTFTRTAEIMAGFMAEVRGSLGLTLPELNLGGGYGIYYTHEDSPSPPEAIAEAIGKVLAGAFKRNDFPFPERFSVEPGRSIVGNAGTALYTVGSVKHIPGFRTYVAVDGGMTDNPRLALYQAKYETCLANKMSAPDEIVASVAGKLCESGDMLIRDVSMPRAEAGDVLAIPNSGAYQYAMASNYNRIGKPAVVLVSGGDASLILRRETLEDLIRYDLVPGHLK